ncbi:low molecular weight protein-tyrosine-phosphatase [Rubrivivax sp. A210]|uniref:low molecular weight protein-tyrosine-phosphatase n=1 Tax=Rubrivivax sp. A210 TaxID=2772301 RepID=UPI001919084A|nr:low molecular weight protein-tyrosine-phosphatase [Rubrivivax sp. A210]
MVCMGNICRSPTAEAVLRGKLQRAGLDKRVRVDSAGMTDYHAGEPPDPRSTAHAAQRGYDLKPLRARPVEAADFERFDWLLGMDEANLAWLHKRAPAGTAERCQLLLPFAGRADGVHEVPDPYYGGPAGFDHVLDLVEDACERLLPRLARGELGRAAGRGGKA